MRPSLPTSAGPQRVVCLGGGEVAAALAHSMRRAIRDGRVDLVVVGRDRHFTRRGLVPELLSSRLGPGQVSSPAAPTFQPARFEHAEVEALDLSTQRVKLRRAADGQPLELPYDHLVLGLGASTDATEDLAGDTPLLKLETRADCLAARGHLLALLELAELENDPLERRRLLTAVVVGGNLAGVQVALELVDYFLFVNRREYPRIHPEEARMVIVHPGDGILPELRPHYPRLVRAVERHVERRGLRVRLATRLVSVTADEAVLDTGERIPTRTIIGCGAVPSTALLATPALPIDGQGRVVTDRFARVVGWDNVWAAGDCAAVPHPRLGTCPPLAGYARAGGRLITENLHRASLGRPLATHRRELVAACGLGHRTAVTQLGGLLLRGLPAWLTWRATLLAGSPHPERRARLLLDWLVGRRPDEAEPAEQHSVSEVLYEPGQVIVKQGDVGRALYVIVSGQTEVVREHPDGEQRLAVLGPGEHFGEIAVFQNVRRTATVRALGRVHLLALGRPAAISLSHTHPHFGEAIRRLPGPPSTEGPRPPPASLGA